MGRKHRFTIEQEEDITELVLRGRKAKYIANKLECGVATIYKIIERNKGTIYTRYPELMPIQGLGKLDDQAVINELKETRLNATSDTITSATIRGIFQATPDDHHNMAEVQRWRAENKGVRSRDDGDIKPPDLKGDGIYVTEWRDGVLWMQNPNNPDEWKPVEDPETSKDKKEEVK